MGRKNKVLPVFENVKVIDAGAEGKAIARVNEQVVFIPYVAPGDVIDVKIKKKRRSYMNGEAIKFHSYSDQRVQPMCEHFGSCGGCKWQHLDYKYQLQFKQKQVKDNLERLGKFEMPEINTILGSENIYYYRNKLEYTFSNKRWLTDYSKEIDFDEIDMDGFGFHMPGMFDRILDINNCYLQADPSNDIRLVFKKHAKQLNYEFYNVKDWTGFLRNVVIRTTTTGDLMIILVVNDNDEEKIFKLLDIIADEFPQITSLMYVVNTKHNSVITDLEIKLYRGNPYIIEEMEGLKFKIGPVSFYQTNSNQAYELYKVVREFADLKGDEVVYDLYTGTGTIANFISKNAKKVIGIEYVESAIEDALENSLLNKISNCSFFAGDIAKVLNEKFVLQNGKPDVIITDPPRAGMHGDVVNQILTIQAEKIVYVSCNPATQARDITLLDELYEVEKIQPLDMFPHTQHVENVVLLKRRG